MNGFPWELYHLDRDWTQANDLAAKMPDKLRAMQQLFALEVDEAPGLPARRHATRPIHRAQADV
jgi:arylsulfatase